MAPNSKCSGSWERPIQGVSQQADKDRINGQCTLQENFIPSAINGLVKRIGTKHIAKIMSSVSDKAIWHIYDRGEGEVYLVCIAPSAYPRVFDLLGNEKTVNVGTVTDTYVKNTDPALNLRMKTIADYTFLVNTTIATATRADVQSTNPDTAIIYCQYATYGRDYQVYIDGVLKATYTTPDGSTASHVNYVKTNYIIEQLAGQIGGQALTENTLTVQVAFEGLYIDTNVPVISLKWLYNSSTGEFVEYEEQTQHTGYTRYILPAGSATAGDTIHAVFLASGDSGYNVEVHGNCMFVTKKTSGTFSITTIDSANNEDLIAIQDKVAEVASLPPYAPEGYIIKVQNAEGYDANAFWLQAVVDNEDQSGSSVDWQECSAQGSVLGFNRATMPHVLISESNGTFTFRQGEWEDRAAGNDTTNPMPSFLGYKLSAIGMLQDRLYVTSGESCIASRTANFFNFFKETTQTTTSSDPIDVSADTDDVNNLKHSITLDGDAVFFSEHGQFMIKGDKALARDEVVFRKVTSYPMNTDAAPAATGESVVFSFASGKFAGLREMFTDSYTDTKRAYPLTDHVREYILGTPKIIASSPNINTLIVLTDNSKRELYVYDWVWQNDQKVQSAFHKWIFNSDILFAKFISDKLYFVMRQSDGIYIEQVPVGNDADDVGLNFPCRLDRLTTVTATKLEGVWSFTAPYSIDDINNHYVVMSTGCHSEFLGSAVEATQVAGLSYSIEEDMSDLSTVTLLFGRKFEARYIPTKPSIKDAQGRVLGLDRLVLGKVRINYESTGEVDVTVKDTMAYDKSWTYNFSGRVIGRWNNVLGTPELIAGYHEFPVRLPSEQALMTITSSDFKPFIIRDLEWQGMFNQRGRRL